MSNLSYCRFQNTFLVLEDCKGALNDLLNNEPPLLSPNEAEAAAKMISCCREIYLSISRECGGCCDEESVKNLLAEYTRKAVKRMKARSQREHEEFNAVNYPGTRQMCVRCDEPTGKCEEDSLWSDCGNGPFCELCYDKMESNTASIVEMADCCICCKRCPIESMIDPATQKHSDDLVCSQSCADVWNQRKCEE